MITEVEMQLKYKRVIIKISGEALMSEKEQPLDFDIVGKVADQLIEIANMGAQIGIIMVIWTVCRPIIWVCSRRL